MKILVVGDYPPPYGGIAVHVEQLHRFLRREGVESRVLDIGKGGRPDPDVLPVRSRARYVSQLIGFARRGWLIHLHTTGDNSNSWLAIASVAAVGRGLGLAPVVTLHSGLLPRFLRGSAARRLRARALLGRCGHVVAVSEEIRSALLNARVDRVKISVHPPFFASQVEPGEVPPLFDRVRSERDPLLAMANHPAPLYGRSLMLRALRRLAEDHPRVGLALFGAGVPADQLAAEAEAEGVEQRVHDFGELSHSNALALMRACNAFVRPTTADGDAVSVREALALGVPCVASDAVPRPNGVVLFRTSDAADLAAKISRALASDARSIETPDAGPALLRLYAKSFAARSATTRSAPQASPEEKRGGGQTRLGLGDR